LPSSHTQRLRSSYTPELGRNKQLLYREAHKRIKRAIKKGSHIEAVALLESIMSDRIESAISVVTRKQVSVSSLGKLFRTLDNLVPADENLRTSIQDWNKARGFVIHQMVKITNDTFSTWSERIIFARLTAKEGLIILNELRKYTDRIIRQHK
jgi:hypothetical protein